MINLKSKINPVAVLKGLVVLAIISFASYFFQYAYFMIEVSRAGKGFASGGEQIASSFKMVSINAALQFFAYIVCTSRDLI